MTDKTYYIIKGDGINDDEVIAQTNKKEYAKKITVALCSQELRNGATKTSYAFTDIDQHFGIKVNN